jgi:peptidoglycan/LPS O-acetylase OafA/YrhL
MLSNALPSKSNEVLSLTGLRGVAAIYVVLYHATGYLSFPGGMQGFIKHGYISVDLFFVLSGFVMAMTYGRMFAQTSETSFDLKTFKTFIILRLARVWPLFALMTLITAALIPTVLGKAYYHEDLGRALMSNFTMTQTWGMSNSIVRPSWSISTEWAAYLLFPVLVMGALNRSRVIAFLSLTIAILSLSLIAYGPLWFGQGLRRVGPLDLASSYAVATHIRCLGAFVIGMVAFRFRHWVPSRAAPLIGILIFGLLFWRASDVILVGLFGLLIMSLSADKGVIAKALSHPIVYSLGLWSYAIYLIHDLILFLVFKTFAGLNLGAYQALGLAVLVTIGLSALAYYGFEKPTRAYLRRKLKPNPEFSPINAPAIIGTSSPPNVIKPLGTGGKSQAASGSS